MYVVNRKSAVLLICLASIFLFSGCTNWKKKYQSLKVEHENVQGLLERARTEKGQLTAQVTQSEQTIDELQKKIAEQNQSPAEATGFGKEYDVRFNPDAGTITVTLENSLLFDAGRAILKKETIAELNHIQAVLADRYPGKQIDVVGHTDSDPIKRSKWKDNWELSAQRALTIVRYLINQGVAEDKIREVGCGAARPVASNATISGKAKNRRVEIVVHIK